MDGLVISHPLILFYGFMVWFLLNSLGVIPYLDLKTVEK